MSVIQKNKPGAALKLRSIGRDFILLSVVISIATFLLASWFYWQIYNNESHQIIRTMDSQSERIERTLMDTVDYTAYIMSYLNDQVKLHGSDDLKYINQLYSSFRLNSDVNTRIPWNMFSWVNSKDLLVVNSDHGILEEPVNVEARDYIPLGKVSPGKIHLGKASYGKISYEPIIPAGMGIYNNNGKYLGTTVFGFKIKNLTTKIEGIINAEGVNFALIDGDLQIILESKNRSISNNPSIVTPLKKLNFNKIGSGVLSTPGFLNKEVFSFYKMIPSIGYAIIVSYDRPLTNKRIFYSLIGRISELMFIAITVILSLLFLYRRIISPMVSLSDVALNLSNGNTNVTIPAVNNTEAANLANAMDKVKQLIINEQFLKRDLYIAKDEALMAKKIAESATKSKTEFLASTAHELRSPLNAIIGMSEVIKTKMFGDKVDSYVEYAGDIEQSGFELLEFITDLLDNSKAENGDFTLDHEEWIDLENIIHRARKLNISRANKLNIRIDMHVEEKLPRLFADGRRLRQVLVNLISNSIKYSHPDIVINISAFTREGKIILTVSDQGFGMTQEQIAIALTKWGMVENKNSGKVDSSGLGLPLSKRLIELHGAEFLIDSTPGKGTVITIVFPAERVAKD